MSQINTNGIDANYPIPGQNNSSQGFRDNFAQIKNNLNTAGDEITDLQTKVVLKAPLEGTALNNEMANALISGASIKNFRRVTYNLGSNLSGRVIVDTSIADVFFGIITGDASLQFTKWAPTNTERSIVLRLTFDSDTAEVQFPSSANINSNDFGVALLENVKEDNDIAVITKPATSDIVELNISTLDCGDTITVTPVNRPFKSTQIVERTVSPTGLPGDVSGTVAVDANYFYVSTGDFDSEIYPKTVLETSSSGNAITLSNATDLVVDIPVIFTGNVDTANTNIVENQWYYVKSITGSDITISDSRVAGVAGNTFAIGTSTTVDATATFYVGTDIWKRVELGTW